MHRRDAVGVGGWGAQDPAEGSTLLHLMPIPSTDQAAPFWGLMQARSLEKDFLFASAGILGLSWCISYQEEPRW